MTPLKTENPLVRILEFGQSVWYDGFVPIAQFRRMIAEDGVRGATTNPAIFEKALAGYPGEAGLSRRESPGGAEEIYKALTVNAVKDVADVFRPLYEEARGQDGFVSIEVNPLLAYETQRTVDEAHELWRRVGRKNVMVKVPATREGLPAVRTLIADGVNVNITLIFSIERYREVMDAYLGGLEERLRRGEGITGVASVASFFVSRVDTAVDKALEEKIARAPESERRILESLLGKAAVSNSKLAYEEFQRVFAGDRFRKLERAGAQVQRPLWASTGTKNPRYSDVLYVESLIGPRTVNTMPPATLDAFRDHGNPAPRLAEDIPSARKTLEELGRWGIDLNLITAGLERAGVELFGDSYRKLIGLIEAKKGL